MTLRLSRAMMAKPAKKLQVHPDQSGPKDIKDISVVDEINKCIRSSNAMPVKSYFRPSSMGRCHRQGAYHYLRTPKTSGFIDERLQRILDNGSAIHAILQDQYLRRSLNFYVAHEVEAWDRELEVFGHIDSVFLGRTWEHEPFMVEYKSINSNGYKRLVKPMKPHVMQANIYMRILKLRYCFIVYWNKDTQHLREFLIEANDEVIHDVRKWIGQVQRYLKKGKLPPYRKSTCDETLCPYVPQCRRERKQEQKK